MGKRINWDCILAQGQRTQNLPFLSEKEGYLYNLQLIPLTYQLWMPLTYQLWMPLEELPFHEKLQQQEWNVETE